MSPKWHYHVLVEDPKTHIVKTKISGVRPASDKLQLFLPAWCPGSYCIRDYAGAVRGLMVRGEKGEPIFFEQTSKGTWDIDFKRADFVYTGKHFEIYYEVYCHELTVRTSHVDEAHAYLNGPTYLMGISGEEAESIQLTVNFPPLWSKLSTVLKDVSNKRDEFVYEARDYHHLMDAPIEIGCHETDGFRYQNKDHELAFFGHLLPHEQNLKQDIQTLVENIGTLFGDLPFERYMFMAHFQPGLVGGLEHAECSVLHADCTQMQNRQHYIDWLSLVAHEYFHAWNVKKIRPQEFLQIDYLRENYTRMLWLFEGLTTCMDDWFVYRAGLSHLSEYLEQLKRALNQYYLCPGKKFHSLEDSSFNAWVKFYKPNENSNNSSINYYLKGRLVFWGLHCLLVENGQHLDEFVRELWEQTKQNPTRGWTKAQVMQLLEDLSNKKIRETMENMLSTTHDIDFEALFKKIGLEFCYQSDRAPYMGVDFEFKQARVFAKSVVLDGPAYKAGINAGDEIIALNNLRLDASNIAKLPRMVLEGKPYNIMLSRYGNLITLQVVFERAPRVVEAIRVVDQERALKALAAKW